MSGTTIEKYISELARELSQRGCLAPRFMEETREHLADAVDAGQRRGLEPQAAMEEAIQRYGEPSTVAAKYAAEKQRTLHWVLLVVAVAMGLAIAWMDSRPHWDDSGISAGALLLSAGVLGVIGPRRPWLWALAIGIWIPLYLIVGRITSDRFTLGTMSYVIILAFPMAGAYAGMGLRRMIAAMA
jgi:hypothetical protein